MTRGKALYFSGKFGMVATRGSKGELMRRSLLLALVALACWAKLAPVSAAFTRCLFFAGTADALVKSNAVDESLKSLREAIDKWKADNGVTGPGERNRGEVGAAPLLAKLGLAEPVPRPRRGERHSLYALLAGRSVTRRLHLRR
jgi:hypothetical protein